jgi:hypothetical protein
MIVGVGVSVGSAVGARVGVWLAVGVWLDVGATVRVGIAVGWAGAASVGVFVRGGEVAMGREGTAVTAITAISVTTKLVAAGVNTTASLWQPNNRIDATHKIVRQDMQQIIICFLFRNNLAAEPGI